MQTRLITTEPELAALKDSWNSLVRDNPETNLPFYSWEWFEASWNHFGKPEGRSLFVVVVEDGPRLLGVLPLVAGLRKSSGLSYRTLEFCNAGMNPRNTAYYDSTCPVPVFQALANALDAGKESWDMVELANVEQSTAFHGYWTEKGGAPFSWIRTHGFTAPFIELTGSMDDYLAGLSKGTRKNLRKHLKLFQDTGGTKDIRFFKKPEEAGEGLDLVLQVRSKSWKGAFRNEHYVRFFREMTPVLSRRNELAIVVIMLDGVPIASAYAMAKDGIYYGNLRDYDQDYKHLAPGILLLHYQLEDLHESGGSMFDFCGTSYDHKVKFSTGMKYHSTFQIFHSGWKSRFLFSAKTLWLPLLRKVLRKPEPDDLISIGPSPALAKKNGLET